MRGALKHEAESEQTDQTEGPREALRAGDELTNEQQYRLTRSAFLVLFLEDAPGGVSLLSGITGTSEEIIQRGRGEVLESDPYLLNSSEWPEGMKKDGRKKASGSETCRWSRNEAQRCRSSP